MTILITGSNGAIGSQLVTYLAAKGANVHALVRKTPATKLPERVKPVQGDMTDVDSMRAALAPIKTLFLLNAVTPDEVTQALIALNLAHEAGIERIVYLSVIHSDKYTNVPHFTGKFTVERMIENFDLPATILRPAYFMQNDAGLKDAILGHGVYPMPIGRVGLSMIDTRDLAEVAGIHLLRREQAAKPLPREIIDVVGPDILTGEIIAAIWAKILDRRVQYAGDDSIAFEKRMRAFLPSWMAYDLRMMVDQFQRLGMVADAGDTKALTALLGRPLRSYENLALELSRQWRQTQ
jgi:uncharacterized protein YbjT (DUF2867 family)